MNKKVLDDIKNYSVQVYSQSRDRQHGLNHVERVRNNALKISKMIDNKELVDLNLLQAACYLHDVVMCMNNGTNLSILINHFLEKPLNRKHLPKIVKGFNLAEGESKILLNSVINHPYSIPYRVLNKNKDIYSKILQDADSMDYASFEREATFHSQRSSLMMVISRLYMSVIRKNIKYFLNFPQIAHEIPQVGTILVK